MDTTSLWLHNKLGTSNDSSWTSGSICSQLNKEVLKNIKECFPDLQTQVKLKLLLSFFHIPRRLVEEVNTSCSWSTFDCRAQCPWKTPQTPRMVEHIAKGVCCFLLLLLLPPSTSALYLHPISHLTIQSPHNRVYYPFSTCPEHTTRHPETETLSHWFSLHFCSGRRSWKKSSRWPASTRSYGCP